MMDEFCHPEGTEIQPSRGLNSIGEVVHVAKITSLLFVLMVVIVQTSSSYWD